MRIQDLLKALLTLVIICFACIFLLILLIICTGKGKHFDERKVIIKNESNDTIYCFCSRDDSFLYSKPLIINEYLCPDSIGFFIDRSWDIEEIYSDGGKIRFSILSKDSINKYGLDSIIRNGTIYTKKYEYNLNELDSINWTIVYPSTEATKE